MSLLEDLQEALIRGHSEAGAPYPPELACQSILTILMNFGFLVFGLPDYVDKQLTLNYGAIMAGGSCSDGEKAACRKMGNRSAQWAGIFFDG